MARTWDELLTTTTQMDLDLPPQLGGESPGQYSQSTPPPAEEMVAHTSPLSAPPSLGSFASSPTTPADEDSNGEGPEPDPNTPH